MGKHYVPQAHLRRFAINDRPDFVWMYDKKTRKFSQAVISKVAQEPDFYSPDVERALAKTVELPGNQCIDRLLRREKLDNAERTQLSLYMMIMATRGPRQRRKSVELIPEVLDGLVAETREWLESQIRQGGSDVEWVVSRLGELEAVHQKFAQETPPQIIDQIRTPFWSERTVEAIHNMAWHIIPASPPSYFVTCDTPAHFFEGQGLENQDSEFTFPISKSFALVGEHRHSAGIYFEKSRTQFTKEVTRRILSHAERFVFSPMKDTWIDTVAQKSNPFLSHIRWDR
jgi:hypothetical protein